jgi:hypothetical protein
MPIILAAIVGRAFGLVLGRVVFSHAVLTVVVWFGLSAISFWLADRNLGPWAGPYATVAAPMALLAWTLRRPAESRAKLWLFDGFYVWTRLGVAWAVVVAIARLVADDGSLARWLLDAWPYALVGVGSWLTQRALTEWLRRSHVRAGDLSVVGD